MQSPKHRPATSKPGGKITHGSGKPENVGKPGIPRTKGSAQDMAGCGKKSGWKGR